MRSYLFVWIREANHCGFWHHEEEHQHPHTGNDEAWDYEGEAPVVADKGCRNDCSQDVAQRGVRVPDAHDQSFKET